MAELVIYEDQHPIWSKLPERQSFTERDENGLYIYKPSGEIEYWVDIMIDCVPAMGRWWMPWRRWFCEVHARQSAFPRSKTGKDPADLVWYHYWNHDFYAPSLRRAFLRSWKVAEGLSDLMQTDPNHRPEALGFEHHSHP